MPLTKKFFEDMASIGRDLRTLHIEMNVDMKEIKTKYPIEGDNKVEKIKFEDKKIFVNGTQYFSEIPENIYRFFIGGYQPLEKWLKDRKGRNLNFEDISHYQTMVEVIRLTIDKMEALDKIYSSGKNI